MGEGLHPAAIFQEIVFRASPLVDQGSRSFRKLRSVSCEVVGPGNQFFRAAGLRPALAYRLDRQPWRVIIEAGVVNEEMAGHLLTLDLRAFSVLLWRNIERAEALAGV